MEKIEPYLVISRKKARAHFIISNYKKVTVRNGKYNEEGRILKEKFYTDFMAI